VFVALGEILDFEFRLLISQMRLLEVKNLKMDFGKNSEAASAIDDVSFSIGTGETGMRRQNAGIS
jgi:hypothetical protein